MTEEGTTQATLGDSADPGGSESAAAAAAREVAGDGGANAEITDPAARRYPDADGAVEIAVTQVDYTVEGSGRDETPIIHVFGRTDEDEVEHVRVHEFRPYFYVPSKSLDEDDDRLDHDRITGWEETAPDGDSYESIRGEPLTKIFGQTPRDVGRIRDRFDHYEADVLFPNRFLIDMDVTSGLRVPERRATDGALVVPHDEVDPIEMQAEARVCTFDIEVDDRSGFPEDGEEPIVCLSSHDSSRDEYAVWLYEAPGGTAGPEQLTNYEAIDGGSGEVDGDGGDGTAGIDADVHRFDTEEAMLAAFLDYIEETDPDVTTGWNFTDFDAPYFIDRLEALGGAECDGHDLDPDRLSRVNEVWRSDWQGPNVKGRVVFDLLYAYQRTQFTELDSYRLDAVGEVELGAGKERYPGDIGDLWEDDPERLLEYNLRDVELCVEIDRQQGVIPFWQEVASFVGCKLEDATTPGDAVDMYVLHEAHGKFALPSKGQQETEEFEGGAVFDPITGVKEMVSVLDLKCFSGDTELVTPTGIRNIQELSVGDPVYTLNPETFECEIKPVVDTQSYPNQYGELHHVEGNTHDLKVTENHRFLVSNTRGWDGLGPEDYDLREYRDLPDANRFAFPNHEPIAGAAADEFSLCEATDDAHAVVYAHDGLTSFRAAMPTADESSLDWANGTSLLAATTEKTGKYLIPIDSYRANRDVIDEHADEVFLKYDRGHQEMPLSVSMDDWLELIGWFVTEGSFIRETPGIVLHQRDETGRAAIRDLLERMRLNYSVDENGFSLSNRILHDWFLDNCGDGYANKRVPEWVFELDGAQLDGLLETLILGDGRRTESGLGKFWTKSDQLKRDVVRLAVQCGHKPTVSKQEDGTWYVSIGKRGSFEKRDNATVEDHNGDVHCVTAKDNHVVLAGRNGRFQWIGQSLYPMSMVTINASPETQVDPDSYDGETYRTPTGIHFRKSPDGIIREMVDELLTEREEKKARRDDHPPGTGEYQRLDRQQQAVKVIMNSLYGVFGWDRFRLYDRGMSAGVTSTNREVIAHTERAANELDHQVAYGDTDSVMIELGGDTSKERAIEQSFAIAEHINGSYDEFARGTLNADDHRFQIEFEKLYRRFFQAGKKKRYAGHIIWKEGANVDDVDITGFEYKRSDIAPITKRVQREVIDRIVHGEDLDEVKTYLRDVIDRFENGAMDVEQVGVPGGIGKRLDDYDTDTAQVRGAKYANLLLGTNFQRGSKPKRLYLDRVDGRFYQRLETERPEVTEHPLYDEFRRDVSQGKGVICFEYADQVPEEFAVDWEKMLEKTLKGPIARVVEAVGIAWDEVRSGQTQTGLGSFT